MIVPTDPVIATLQSLLPPAAAPGAESRFADALRAAVQARHDLLSAGASRTSMAPYRLKRVQEYVDTHLHSELRLKDLAAAAGVSPYHFCRQFKIATGVSPLRYVLERRVERAKRELLDTHEPIITVAVALGFSSQSRFTAVFRKFTGLTPRAYRNAYRR